MDDSGFDEIDKKLRPDQFVRGERKTSAVTVKDDKTRVTQKTSSNTAVRSVSVTLSPDKLNWRRHLNQKFEKLIRFSEQAQKAHKLRIRRRPRNTNGVLKFQDVMDLIPEKEN